MTSNSPPPEAHRYRESQTPESPRPVHIPEPSNIPVLLNQMDPVFNDTATYNIPHNQTFSPMPEGSDGTVGKIPEEHDAVQSFFREAENQAAAEPAMNAVQSAIPHPDLSSEAISFHSVPVPNNYETNPQDIPIILPDLTNPPEMAQDLMAVEPHSLDEQPSRTAQSGNRTSQTESTRAQQEMATEPSKSEGGDELHSQVQLNSDEKDGVDYQSLLDTITQSASTAPSAASMMIATTSDTQPQSSSVQLPSVAGLPPKPPPQQNPTDFPSYVFPNSASQQISQETSVAIAPGDVRPSEQSNHSSVSMITPSGLNDTSHVLNEITPSTNGFVPSLTSQPPTVLAPGQTPSAQGSNSVDIQRSQDPAERPWSPRTQISYDQFLEEERRYVTEGIWDKFPAGSRLFVGNLPSEKVTKRDLYHKFHKHGKLAQISIKQAYGFVQFLEASACLNALNAEQGVEIRGRKVHLEISKPQKNTRGAGSKANQTQARKRSRSPERNNRRTYSDYRDEHNRRPSDYRTRRSPSPQRYRSRDDYRPPSRDGRPRSPIYPPNFAPPPAVYDDEATLPLPRRDPRSVPDVQLLVLESEVMHNFINWVEQGFRMKGLQASTTWMNPRLPLSAVIKRQIIEGVQAVVKLTRLAQSSGKIPLQVFDRTTGASNVNFNEYVDLDLNVAADIVSQARMRERSLPHSGGPDYRSPIYPPQPAYSQPTQYPTHQPPVPFPPSFQQLPASASQPYPYAAPTGIHRPPSQPPQTPIAQQQNLQQLLANLRQPSNQHESAQGNSGPGATQPPQFIANTGAPQAYGPYGPTTGYPGGGHQSGGQPQPNVQNIMEQLARYQR